MKGLDILGKIMAQVTSGRWLITIAATYCLIKLTHTLCDLMSQGKINLEASTYVAIVMSVLNAIGMVTVFYFQKTRPGDGNGNGNGNGDIITDTTATTTLK